MNERENLLSLYRRQGYERAPVHFVLCPELEDKFRERYPDAEDYVEHFEFPMRVITDPAFPWIAEIPGFVPEREWDYDRYYDPPIRPGARMDIWGIAHETGSELAHHMTHMRHPLEKASSLEELQAYPWPEFDKADWSYLKPEVQAIQARGLAAQVWMECTIWEVAWYLRRMDVLMLDMALRDEKATFLLDKITDLACYRAARFAEAGADVLALGDDFGMQETCMMSNEMYREWIQPRMRRVMDAARARKPEIIIQYHTCGYIEPLVGEFLDAGIDVLNPVQPECNSFDRIHAEYGDRLSFNGTIGTQTTMPFGSTDDVREAVLHNLELAGPEGGLLCCPTHMLEPEVPWENVEAYVAACREFSTAGA